MPDDIREVMRSTQFTPLKRTDRSGDHKRNSEGGSGGWQDEEGGEKPQTPIEASELDALVREIEQANARLADAGKAVRLRLAAARGTHVIEITLPAEAGGVVVTRTIAAGDIKEWAMRLETAEGLMIDERL